MYLYIYIDRFIYFIIIFFTYINLEKYDHHSVYIESQTGWGG